MITGAQLLLYSRDPEADRAFLRDAMDLPAVDAGGGWLIFALPPAELGVHPGDRVQHHAEHDLMGWEWGRKTTIRLPSGGELGLYQPTHLTAL